MAHEIICAVNLCKSVLIEVVRPVARSLAEHIYYVDFEILRESFECLEVEGRSATKSMKHNQRGLTNRL